MAPKGLDISIGDSFWKRMMNDDPEVNLASYEDQSRVPRSGRLFGAFILVFLFHCSSSPPRIVAQQEAPLINRPASNFYHAHGTAVKVAWSLDRTTIPEDGELIATLTIKGATNPQRIVRPDLTKLPEFQTRFVITDKTDQEPEERAPEVKFTYLLRPRSRSVDKVPMLEFYFYNPTASQGKNQFPLTTAAKVSITVTEAPKLEPPAIPLREPDQLFVVNAGPQVLEKRQFITGWWPWLIVGLAGPICALTWFLAWQRVFPDARRLAKMRQTRAARRATDAIRRANLANDPPAAIATTVLNYLRTRFPLPPGAVTPGEIETALGDLKVSVHVCTAVAEFFRSCDAARFAPSNDIGSSLAADAESLIVRLEVE
jgi:hypothetical protein